MATKGTFFHMALIQYQSSRIWFKSCLRAQVERDPKDCIESVKRRKTKRRFSSPRYLVDEQWRTIKSTFYLSSDPRPRGGGELVRGAAGDGARRPHRLPGGLVADERAAAAPLHRAARAPVLRRPAAPPRPAARRLPRQLRLALLHAFTAEMYAHVEVTLRDSTLTEVFASSEILHDVPPLHSSERVDPFVGCCAFTCL